MNDKFKNKWENAQMEGWKNNAAVVQDFFNRFSIDIKETYIKLCKLLYNKQQPVMYLFGKIEKMIAICDFLDTLATNNHADVDKIKIFQLISHSEIIMNNLGLHSTDTKKVDLIVSFFEPVKDKLQHGLRLAIEHTNSLTENHQDASSARILFKLRNEYAHQGNFTGKVFLSGTMEDRVYNSFSFDWDMPKTKPVNVCAITNLTYNNFLNIYFFAFKIHLESYISKSV